MMTWEEREKRLRSVRAMSSIMLDKWLDNTPRKLQAFLDWFEPPATIRKSVESRIKRLHAESNQAYELRKKLDKIDEKLFALPTIASYDFYGETRTYIHKGMLPDFEETSTDEGEALKMLEEYYAAEATA